MIRVLGPTTDPGTRHITSAELAGLVQQHTLGPFHLPDRRHELQPEEEALVDEFLHFSVPILRVLPEDINDLVDPGLTKLTPRLSIDAILADLGRVLRDRPGELCTANPYPARRRPSTRL